MVSPPGSSAWPLDYPYCGLATPFQNLAFTGKLSYVGWDPINISLLGKFVANRAYNSSSINQLAVNNPRRDLSPTRVVKTRRASGRRKLPTP